MFWKTRNALLCLAELSQSLNIDIYVILRIYFQQTLFYRIQCQDTGNRNDDTNKQESGINQMKLS